MSTMICPACKRIHERENARLCEMCGTELVASDQYEAPEELDLFDIADLPFEPDPTKPQYKVVSQKDRFFSQKFDPALIERALNEYAQEGWTMKSAVTADFGSFGGSRNELIIFLEKAPQE